MRLSEYVNKWFRSLILVPVFLNCLMPSARGESHDDRARKSLAAIKQRLVVSRKEKEKKVDFYPDEKILDECLRTLKTGDDSPLSEADRKAVLDPKGKGLGTTLLVEPRPRGLRNSFSTYQPDFPGIPHCGDTWGLKMSFRGISPCGEPWGGRSFFPGFQAPMDFGITALERITERLMRTASSYDDTFEGNRLEIERAQIAKLPSGEIQRMEKEAGDLLLKIQVWKNIRDDLKSGDYKAQLSALTEYLKEVGETGNAKLILSDRPLYESRGTYRAIKQTVSDRLREMELKHINLSLPLEAAGRIESADRETARRPERRAELLKQIMACKDLHPSLTQLVEPWIPRLEAKPAQKLK